MARTKEKCQNCGRYDFLEGIAKECESCWTSHHDCYCTNPEPEESK